MSSRSSPANGGYEAASGDASKRLSVRKDLFPEVRIPKLVPLPADEMTIRDDLGDVSCVKLETDFEQSIDEIANEKLQVANGLLEPGHRSKHRKHRRSRRDRERSERAHRHNGCLPPETKRRKCSLRNADRTSVTVADSGAPCAVKGGKNLSLVSSSKSYAEDDSSDDEVLKCSVKLPLMSLPRQSGKPYSHELSQLSSKKKKSETKVRRSHVVVPSSGKPRSMMGICSSRSKKKSSSKKSERTATYHSQIVDTDTIKLKIRKSNSHVQNVPISIADIGQTKSKKRKAHTPEPCESSGEEYDPTQGDTPASISVAAPKSRHPPPRSKKESSTKQKEKGEPHRQGRAERQSRCERQSATPQSPWGNQLPEHVLEKIFEYTIWSEGTLPTVVRVGRVCRLWHSVSCHNQLWRSVELAQNTVDKCKTDYKLIWLLENRLTKCHTLNLAHWKVSDVGWVVACLATYCPGLVELSVAGWSRLTPEQLHELVQGLPCLERLDLSLTSEQGGSGSCLTAASMARVTADAGPRITHLTLANNKFTALQQILTSIASHCCNLEVLDISGARATSHPTALPLEALQKGCPKLRVFRAANSQLVLASATTSQQMEAGGWCALEELSIAGVALVGPLAVGEYATHALDDEALARLVRGATRLRLLDLRNLRNLTHSGLVRVPAWDLQHLFLGGCKVTRQSSACLELICEKWSHSLLEVDMAWATATGPLDSAVEALAERGSTSKLRILNLCGSSVSLEPVKKVLLKCPQLESINLSSCRALPRGMKRQYNGKELQDLKDSLDPVKLKAKMEAEIAEKEKKEAAKRKTDTKSDSTTSPEGGSEDGSQLKSDIDDLSEKLVLPLQGSDVQTTQSVTELCGELVNNSVDKGDASLPKTQLNSSGTPEAFHKITSAEGFSKTSPEDQQLSPMVQSNPDSSSTPRSDNAKQSRSPYFSPAPKPDSQAQNSPEIPQDAMKGSNSWNLGQFKTTPSHNKSEASPLSRLESYTKSKPYKGVDQCSPTPSLDNKPSPESNTGIKHDMKNPNTWNYGNYSPMPRQDGQFSAQPSPYSAQPSPYSTQPSPYSSQPSPYSAQPSPDTSQIVKPELPKTGGNWNTGGFSPMTKQNTHYSPHPSTHTSPDPTIVKNETSRGSKSSGRYSPKSRQERHHRSPYSPRPSVESTPTLYSNRKSPGMGGYSPMLRSDCHLPSPDSGMVQRTAVQGRPHDPYNRTVTKLPDITQKVGGTELPSVWSLERFGTGSGPTTPTVDNSWVPPTYNSDALNSRALMDNIAGMCNASWPGPAFDTGSRAEELNDPWSLGQFRVEPPSTISNTFVEQTVNFDTLGTHMGHQSHIPQSFLDETYSETSRVD